MPATAEAAKPRLAVTSITSHEGARIGPGERFRVTGVLRNRRRNATPALLSASLRGAHVLGAKNLARVPARGKRRFTINAVGPLLPAGVAPRRYALVVCVRPRRGAPVSCRRLKRKVVLVAPAKGSPAPGPTPEPERTPEPSDPFTAGARSAGDRLFPTIGNGGYDAKHYDLALNYDPGTKLLQGTATIDATASKNLSEYSFDLFEMPVSSVLVDGAQATFKQALGKLVVTPPSGLALGTSFTTTVTYASPIVAYTDPDGSEEGWVPTSDGAFVVNEPVGSMSWFPNDNVPTDKATYDLHVTAPGTVLGSGRLLSHTGNTWNWRADEPMASYLVTATNGNFDLTQDGDTYYAVDSTYNAVTKSQMMSRLSQTRSILDFHAGFLGTPYPFSAAGGVVDKSSVGYALETQTKPMYAVSNSVDPVNPLISTIAHELAHQWFGDDVSPATWSDIWLNEGPAEFMSWLWLERTGNEPLTTKQRFDSSYANPAMDWSVPPAAPPTAADMFNTDAMYTRGAMVMEALREIMGEDRFKTVLASYLAAHKYGNASTQQFIDLVKKDGGVDAGQLQIFFQEWLYGAEKPGITPSNFATYSP